MQGIGRSRGGRSTKIHLVVDALGLPVTFTLTEGQRNDITMAPALVEQVRPRRLLADKGYDSNKLRAQLQQLGAEAVIPSGRSRSQAVPYDRETYKARSEVECTFGLLKQFRALATRYDKTMRNYASVVALACAWLWLRI